VAKYKVDQATLDKIRASRSRIPNVPEDSTPPRPEEYRALLTEAAGKAGPWKWLENVTITKTDVTDQTLQSGDEAERIQINFALGDDGANKDYVHAEFYYLRESEDGTLDQMTEISLGNIDAIITACGVEYELDDEGDPDPIATLDVLKGEELRIKLSAGVSAVKNKGFMARVEAVEYLPLD